MSFQLESVKLDSSFASVCENSKTFAPLLLCFVSIVALLVRLCSIYPPALTTHQWHLPKGKGQLLRVHSQCVRQGGGDWRVCRQWLVRAGSLGGRGHFQGRRSCRCHCRVVRLMAWRLSGQDNYPEGRGQQGALGFLLPGPGCGSDRGAALWPGARPHALSLGCRSPPSPRAAASCGLGSSVKENAHNAVIHEQSNNEKKTTLKLQWVEGSIETSTGEQPTWLGLDRREGDPEEPRLVCWTLEHKRKTCQRLCHAAGPAPQEEAPPT